MKRLLLLAVCLFVICAAPACPSPAPPAPNPPPPVPAACDSTPAICAYCDHMRALGCPEGKATPKGAPCEAVTENVQAIAYAAMDLSCRTTARSCDDANRCR